MCLVGASGKPGPSQSHKPESDVGDGGGGGNKMLCVCVCAANGGEERCGGESGVGRGRMEGWFREGGGVRAANTAVERS